MLNEELLGKRIGRYWDFKNLKSIYDYRNCIYILKHVDEYYVGATRNLKTRLYNHKFLKSIQGYGSVEVFIYYNNLKTNKMKEKENEVIEHLLSLNLNLKNKIKSGFFEDTSNMKIPHKFNRMSIVDFRHIVDNGKGIYKISDSTVCNSLYIHYDTDKDNLMSTVGDELVYSKSLDYFIKKYINEDSFDDFDDFILNMEEFLYEEYTYSKSRFSFYDFVYTNKNIITNHMLDILDVVEFDDFDIVDIIVDIILYNPNKFYENNPNKSSYFNKFYENKSKNINKSTSCCY